MKQIAALVLVLSSVVLAGCPLRKKSAAPEGGGGRRLPRVTTAPVVKEAVSWTIECVGTVEARESVAVAAGVAGLVGPVTFREGDEVTPEKILCTIDLDRFTLEQKRAAADVDRAGADLEKARIALKQRIPLHEKRFITDEELADLKAAVARAEAEVARVKAQLALADKALADCRVRPPIAGRINSKGISTGEYVRAETVVATIVDTSELHVRFSVPETEAARLSIGMKVEFLMRAVGGGPVAATIFWVSATADERSRTVECKARLEKPGSDIRPGYSGTVKMVLEIRDGALVIPLEAVLPTERGFVAFVLEGKVARERKLTLGIHAGTEGVEIREGLKAGDVLIVRGASSVRNGSEVEVVKDARVEEEKKK